MREILGGFEQLVWNRHEDRPRALFRLFATLCLLFVVAILVGTFGVLLGVVVDSPGTILSILAEILVLLVLTGTVLAAVSLVDRRTFHDLGLGLDQRWFRDLLAGLALGVAMVASVVFVALLVGVATIDGTLVTREGELLAGLPAVAGVVLGAGFILVLAFLEELLFRGYLLVNVAESLAGSLDDARAVLVAVVVSSGLFGLAHALNPDASLLSALNITLVGVVLAGGYVLTERLAIPVGIHVAWNYALGFGFGLPVSGLTTGVALVEVAFDGDALVTGGGFGPEGGLLALVAVAVSIGGLALWIRRQDGELTLRKQIARPDLRSRN
jgi:membrane protease YdiL (CAAX protease family)